MPKPPIIQTIETALGINLTETQDTIKLAMSAYPRTYTCDADQNVTGLNLSEVGINDFPWFKDLTHLKDLNLSDNDFTSLVLPASLSGLCRLTLSDNVKLKSVTFEKGLPNLEFLDINDCAIARIVLPSGFRDLKRVDCSRNRLEEVIFQGDCPALRSIDLSNNKLKEFILPEGASFSSLNEIFLQNNPLSSTFEDAFKQGNDYFIRYLWQLASQGVTEAYEIKLLIVGEPHAGKTTLWNLLQDPNHPVPDPNQAMTVGIGIKEGYTFQHLAHPDQTFLVNIWDFGGQQIQYMTHQFFLTRRSFYVLLADGRRESANFPYWLKVINLLGADPDGDQRLPVMVVINENGNANPKIPYDPNTIVSDYPKLEILKREVDFAKKDGRFEALVKTIESVLCHNFPHLPLKVPSRWNDVRQELYRLRNEERKNYIDATTFSEVCRSKGVNDDQQIADLSRLFHDLGVILHFQDVPRLHDFIVLNPEWASNAVYELLRHPDIQEKNQGRFTENLLTEVWSKSGFSRTEMDNLLSLMLKDGFEVCFQAKEKGQSIYIAPQLLPQFQPTLDWEERRVVLRYIYQYPFLPKGIVGRLIVRLHKDLESKDEQKVIWEKGMILCTDGCRALVQEITDDSQTGLNQIRIEIIGRNKEDCKYVLRDIRKQMDDIHEESFKALRVEQKIPCVCEECENNGKPHFYSFEDLKRREDKGREDVECSISYKYVKVTDLLYGVYGQRGESLRKPISEGRRIFISYAQEDTQELNELLRQLSPLKQSGAIITWNESDIKPWEDRDAEMSRELHRADIILLLVSPDFLNAEPIKKAVMEQIMKQNENGGVKVIPVFVKPCYWEGQLFAKLNGLPSKEKAVTQYADRNEAWLEVVKGIKKVIG